MRGLPMELGLHVDMFGKTVMACDKRKYVDDHALINFDALNAMQLIKLYLVFSNYRDKSCNGLAKIGVKDYYKEYGINYFNPQIADN
jgi:hypothetical protein